MSSKISVNVSSITDAILETIGLIDSEETHLEINQVFADLADPYVPYRTGALANNIEITAEGVVYKQPYAEEVYDEKVPHSPVHHPLATDHWGEAMLRDRGDEFTAEVAEVISRRLRDGSR